jgi:cytochrome c biogenesis protein CcmG/thiol:disulfide interchange protein DsbE
MSNTDSTTPAPAVPSKRTHILVSIGIVVVSAIFITILSKGLMIDQSKVPPAIIDKEAKAFRVSWVQGQEFLPAAGGDHFRLEDLKGKPVVLNFWASWCISCRQEAHELEKFWQAHKQDVAVVGIAIQDERDAAKKFATYFGKTYMIGLDEDGKAAIDYGVSGVPETFLIDKNGVIRHKEIGPVSVPMLEKELTKIL